MKKFWASSLLILVIAGFISQAGFTYSNPTPNSCFTGKYPVSNVISRGVQRICGMNLFTTAIAQSIVKKEVAKQLQQGKIKVKLKGYSAGDLAAGKIKGFQVSGTDVAYQDVYLSKLNIESMCDFTYFNVKSAVMGSPLFVKYNAEITNNELQKIFSSPSIKQQLQTIDLDISVFNLGKIDFDNIQPLLKDGKIQLKTAVLYKKGLFAFSLPINIETALKIQDDKVMLTNFKFLQQNQNNNLNFLANIPQLNNIEIFDLKTAEQNGADINIKKLKIDGDKIIIEGTFWEPQNTKL